MTTSRASACAALLCVLASCIGIDAQSAPDAEAAITTVAISPDPIVPAQYNGDVRALPPVFVPRSYYLLNEFEGPPNQKPPFAPGPDQDSAQPYMPLAAMPAPLANFAGLSYNAQLNGSDVGSGFPPDTNGDAGIGYYIQSVNDAFGIFDKSTGTLVAGFTENQLWSGAGTGTLCDTSNRGDPVVLYDAVAQRWILTNFAFTSTGGQIFGPYYQCIAVSKTHDPVTGGYWLYAVRMDTGTAGAPPVGTLNDYGKFGIWTDCLYMGANGFNTTASHSNPPYSGGIFAAFDRHAMYSGAPLTGSNSSIGFLSSVSNFYTMIPANLLGPDADSLPPAGTPEYFVYEATTFAFAVRKFVQGPSACGAGSSLGPATNVSQGAYTQPGNVPQLGTSGTLDSLGDRIMQKVQYRRIGSAESLWVVHSTASATAVVRPQWAQIDVSGGTVSTTPLQQQIYAPDATLHRWMASIAADRFGNMAIAYSTSSSTAYPGIAYSGRLVGDPANQLSQSETVLVNGGGSQTFGCGPYFYCPRWGDYSSMSVDPEDDCTFWYTSEYYDTQDQGDNYDWHTRIGAFKFPGCVARSTQTLSFTSNAPLGVTLGDAPRAVTATASSGLVVTLSVDPASTAICTLSGSSSGSLVSYKSSGTCTIDANQFGDNAYRAAPQLQQSFSVAAIFRNGFEAP